MSAPRKINVSPTAKDIEIEDVPEETNRPIPLEPVERVMH